MKNVYKSLKKFAIAIALILLTNTAIAQPNQITVRISNVWTYNVNLNDLGQFRQYRHQAPTSWATGNLWNFWGSPGSWADNGCTPLTIPGLNQVIVPSSPKTYQFAEVITSGCYARMPAVTGGSYYTFNITEKSTPTNVINEDMAILETSYNPVSITSVSRLPLSPRSIDSVVVTANTSAALSAGEFVYLRYSTNSSFTTSTVVPVTMTGTSGTAKIPPQANGSTIFYYVFSSNRTFSQLTSQASTYGQGAYNMLTLNINNNSAANYSYTVTPCAVAPTGITSSVPGCLKPGNTATLTLNGGSLPNGGNFQWYKDVCGTGTFLGTGTSINVSPISTTSYFARATDACGSTSCVTINIVVGDSSVAATSITGVDSICQNVTFKLKRVGGTLGTGATWQWYRVACGGPGVPWEGTGDSIFTQMNPGISYYHLKAEGLCNSTSCAIKAVVIRDSSIKPLSPTPSTICLGTSKTFSANGGRLGHGAQWKWYSGSCGGTLIGSGATLTVSPSSVGTYTYYCRAEGTCNVTPCVVYTLTVSDSSKTPLSISGPTSVCERSAPLVFKPVGGLLSSGASWIWTRVACYGNPFQSGMGSGDSLVVSTSTLGLGSHTVFVRGINGCNMTSCVSKTFVISDTSVPANTINGTSTICRGETSTLSVSGGKLGAGGSWKWYLGNCGGTPIATGNSYAASPTVAGTYTYYARAEGNCNNTICRSFTLTVRDTSTSPISVLASATTICLGQTINLSFNGGNLGHAASWKWYTGSCGGTSIGTGSPLTWGPTSAGTVTVFGRAEGSCNNTLCRSVTITVRDTSKPATAIIGIDSICQNLTFKLKRSGGSLGFGATWQWYRVACGGPGTPWEGTGDSIFTQMNPGISYYYLKAVGACNSTVCAVKAVVIRDSSVRPTEAPSATICLGTSKTFGINGGNPGGSLGHGAQWKWYSGSCGGTLVGTGPTLTVSPSTPGTYLYYRRAEGTCNTTTCAAYTLTVTDSSKTPLSISGPTSVCERSAPLVFKPVGGKLSPGASWTWTRVACHGSPNQSGMGSGDSLVVTTATLGLGTHTVFVRGLNGCNMTSCVSKTFVISDTSLPASGISGSSTICVGESSTLTLSGGKLGAGATWKWYQANCGGTSIATGSSFTVSPSAPGTYNYYARAEGPCNNTICRMFTLTVRDTSYPVVGILGNTTICQGTSTTLTTNGGSLAPGASWKWYSGSCGGTLVGTGSSVTVAPATNTTYFVRAEGTCKNSPCKAAIVTVRDSSLPANSISGPSTVCRGSSITLSVNGGTLGNGAIWRWFSNSCSGTPIGTGSTISVSPVTSTTYFVRAEGTCNNTICRSQQVTVQDTSVPALFINGTTTICRGQSSTFTVVGGSLGTGASWKWYNSSCGVGNIGNGASLTVAPSIPGSYTYFVRAEGNCGSSACISVTLTVRDTSVPAASISGNTLLCRGQNTTLSVVGGSLGHAASWRWYQGSCLGAFAGTGNTLTLTNLAPGTYSYFVRAEGSCNTTICRNITLTVRDTSTPATSIIGTPVICRGQSSTLTLTGGSLGTGATWRWYLGSCGGASAGTGVSITVIPAPGTYTYFARAEGVCNNTVCQSYVVTVRDTSSPATSVTGTLSTLCIGQSTTLSLNGGSLGTGAAWRWYLGNCGFSSPVHSGASLTLSPTVVGTFTYFVRAEGLCNTTPCRSFTITVRDTSVAPSGISGTPTLCQGQSTTLSMNGGTLGTGATWRWYLGSCGGTPIATGVASITVSPATAGSYTYFVRAEGVCNNTICRSFTVTMRDTSGMPISITGPDTICEGGTINLARNGGKTGTGATWNWYRVACGGPGIPWEGTGDNISRKMPAGVHFYYLKADGICNSTPCVVKRVVVVDSSIRPQSTNEFFTTCLGNKRTLTVSGGRLGYRATWKWFATCGGPVLATGPSLTVTPTAPGTYTYFVRAEGICNTTPCAAITFTVTDSSKPATAISGPASVCPGNTPFTLKRVGGSLSPGGRWDWYRGGCGGSGVPWTGTGDSITLTPQMLSVGTHVFYLKGSSSCNTTACVSFTLTIRQAPAMPSAIDGSTNICKGQSTTLSVNGGVQGTNATWTWYSGTCGGTPVGTGASISVSPNDTTTYFVRSEGPCGITGCASVRVDVIQTPAAPVAISANYNQACAGTPIKLYANGPALLKGETRQWYINNGGTLTSIGTGDSITVTLSNTSDIELRTENRCFNSTSVTKQISILNSPVGTWVGVKNSSWHESDNWCGGIPTASTDVVIPSGTPNQPVITALAKARNLTVNSGANLSVAATGALQMNGSLVKSGSFTSAGTVSFLSGGAVTADGFVTRDLEVNLAGEVTLNGNITVTGNLLLGNGSVITGSYEVNVTNDNSNAVVALGGNSNFRSGWIAGNLRRSIKTVDETYQFPVGSIAEGNNAEFINHNVAGVSSVLAHFRPKPGTDVGLNVFETATSNPYGSVSNGGVWYLEPNGSITSGNFDLKLWFHNQPTFTAGLVDNSFSILNRPASSTLASDWVKPPTNSTYIAGSVSSGYVQRNGINAMGQFGMGITLYPVSVKNATINNQIKISPNPFQASFNVKLDLNTVNTISIKVFDQAGRLVVQHNAGRTVGASSISVDASTLPEGVYTVVVEGNEGKLMTSKLLKVKQ